MTYPTAQSTRSTDETTSDPATIAGGWRVFSGSVAGVSHAADGVPCQDVAGHRIIGDSLLLVAVADGAGSAKSSRIGARLAVDSALDTLANHSTGTTQVDSAALRSAFADARETIAHRATLDEQALAAYATTLTCLAVWPHGAIAGRIGDGFGAVEDIAGGLKLLPPDRPRRGEYANETTFLTSVTSDTLDDWLEIREIEGPIRSVAVSTDGLLRLAIELTDYRAYPRFFGPLFAFAGSATATDDQLAAFLASDRVRARTDDDVTLVLAALPSPS